MKIVGAPWSVLVYVRSWQSSNQKESGALIDVSGFV